MKGVKYSLIVCLAMALGSCTEEGTNLPFALNRDHLQVGYTGGVERVEVSASEQWIASTDNPWITISPANGNGPVTCEFLIDSALTAEPRLGAVRIQLLNSNQEREVMVEQAGYPYLIEVDEPEVELANYAKYNDRYFDVKVRTNVDFEVDIPEGVTWLNHETYHVELPRGIRPREVKVRFKWNVNTLPSERLAEVRFSPKEAVELQHQDALNVTQEAAEEIIAGTRAGDSMALLSIQRSLQTLTSWDPSVSMNRWSNVQLWDRSMEGYTPDKEGRVKYAQFMLFNTLEGLPFAVKYLTAAEELYFFGNTNTFMRSLSTGDDIAELTQLKRLTIGAYGLVELPKSLTKLKNLEHLNIGSNNFQHVPDILTPENFPKLRTLIMNAEQRSVINDLSNTSRTDLGGFIDEPEFPEHLIKWDLDTLVLSVNYLQGELPDFLDDDSVPYYSQEDIDAVDTLPQFLVNRVKKVMPSTKRFAINSNRLTGKLPDWLLYHPALDWWVPYSLVFPQEGRDKSGTQAKFSNEPPSLEEYYYPIYTTKEKPTGEE